MRPITKEEYVLLSQALDHLAVVFSRVGIKEVSMVEGIHHFTAKPKINPDILNRFCSTVEKLYLGLPKEAK